MEMDGFGNTTEVLGEDVLSYDYSYKIIVIGDSGVGKSCLTMKGIRNVFSEKHNATVGFEFFTINIKVNGISNRLQIWDTCGQEVYRSLISNFYRNASLAVIVFAFDRCIFN